MRFVDDFFPLLVVAHAARFDEVEFREMAEGYERYFKRNERYALLTVLPGEFVRLGACERRLIADWLNTPRVLESAKRLCVGAANVVPSAVARGALTALLWFWTPPTPLRPAATVDEGVDFCFESLAGAKVPLERPMESIRLGVLDHLRNLGDFGPSLGPTRVKAAELGSRQWWLSAF
jgi:hypothetical protein